MSKKLFTLITLLLMAGLLLVACGGETAEEPTEAPAPTEAADEEMEEPTEEPAVEPTEAPAEEPTEEAAAEPTEEPTEEAASEFETNITIWSDNLLTPVLMELVGPFQEEYGIGLIIEDVPDRNDQFPIAAPAGEGPDIIMLPHDRLGGFVESGLIAPIDLSDKVAEFDPAALQAWTFNGELVGVPYAVENMAFFYNTDLIETPPTTWDELITMGAALVDSGDTTYALALTGTTYDSYPLQTAFGGYVFGLNDDGTYNPNDVGIDSEGMIAAGAFIQENVEAGYISSSTDWDTAHLQFETGEVPFLMAGPWALDRIRTSGVPYGISQFPSATEQGVPFLGVWGFAANALGDNVLLAQTFLTEVLATPETMQVLADGSNRPSAWSSIVSSDPDLAAFGEVAVLAEPMPAIPEMGSVWGSWGDAFTLIINGEQDAADALTNAATQIRDLIGGAAVGMVNIPGSWQAAAGVCEGDWDPACEGSALTDNGDGTYSATFDVPAGEYEVKVALDGGWTVNYGVDGAQDGDNIVFTVDADSPVTFTYDSETHVLTVEVGG
ncbi:MAG: extracellular solute-binding protein [Anaerolineales bacterium]|nr:extracellular solute-binding protein [Anaerolineales bacterium]MCB0018536.1 extracellular solute-binding protein [Anaerolineales bacterium]MCB8959008.1 extracellular solute-binding protein [Ardenticatenales bacterium]